MISIDFYSPCYHGIHGKIPCFHGKFPLFPVLYLAGVTSPVMLTIEYISVERTFEPSRRSMTGKRLKNSVERRHSRRW